MKSVLDPLIQSLCTLPGVGPRSATRMAYYLLHQNPNDALHLAKTIADTLHNTTHCQECNTLTQKSPHDEPSICEVCASPSRDRTTLCIVEMPIDMHALEQTKSYQGLYFVLMGAISPLDGIGANDLAFDKLLAYLKKMNFQEVIIASNFTTQGETTAHYLTKYLSEFDILVTRLARGVPTGNELEYTDAQTIASALFDRRAIFKG
jgi:recombination protein RecR